MRLFRETYLSSRFFMAWSLIIVFFIMGFPFPLFMPLGQTALVFLLALTVAEVFVLYRTKNPVEAYRKVPPLLSLGNDNPIHLDFENRCTLNLSLNIIDELPIQKQERDFRLDLKLKPGQKERLTYRFRPLSRGEYAFGEIRIFASALLGLIERRVSIKASETAKVYPSILDMKKYELAAVSQISSSFGFKKIRRIGHSLEFEQIKEYTRGDDFASINWKATSRSNRLMINSYTDEKSQQVYCILDKSRYMKMPFQGLSLIDYAINSSLIIANTSLRKQDKAGLITFADKVDSIVKADRHKNQLKLILETLYKESETKLEANYELLYQVVRKHITVRSLIFLYANFESMYALERVLPVLRKMNKQHLLVVVVFENTELVQYYQESAKNMEEIYLKTIAQKMANDRYQIIRELEKYGIQSIYTLPQNLSINAINKYLELKSRGMI